MGPFSSINCIKFNNWLFRKNGLVVSIFAMGDNDGNISIWGMIDNSIENNSVKEYETPLYLSKSH